MKQTLLVISTIFILHLTSFAQSDSAMTPVKQLAFLHDHLSVGMNSNFYPFSSAEKRSYFNDFTPPSGYSGTALGWGFHIEYTVNFKNPKNALDIYFSRSNLTYFKSYLGSGGEYNLSILTNSSVSYTRRFLLQKRHPMFASVGLGLDNFVYGTKSYASGDSFYGYSVTSTTPSVSDSIEERLGNGFPGFSINLRVGKYFYFTHNFLKMTLGLNLSTGSSVVNNDYFFYNNGVWKGSTNGEVKASNVELSISYVFSRQKKMRSLIKT